MHTHIQKKRNNSETGMMVAGLPIISVFRCFGKSPTFLVLKEREMSFWSFTRTVFSHAEGILAAPSLDPNKNILPLLFVRGRRCHKSQILLADLQTQGRKFILQPRTFFFLFFCGTCTFTDFHLQERKLVKAGPSFSLSCRIRIVLAAKGEHQQEA